jgi:hypothetical protein
MHGCVHEIAGWRELLVLLEQVLLELQDVAIDDPAEASWREAALEYHKARGRRVGVVSYALEEVARLQRLTDDDVSLERAQRELSTHPSGAAAATVEAIVFGLREGIAALRAHPDRLRRLSELSAEQIKDVCNRVENFKLEIAPPWSAEDVEALVVLWRRHVK